MIDLALIAIVAFIFGAIAGRTDLRASRRAQVVKPGGLYLVWSSKAARKN